MKAFAIIFLILAIGVGYLYRGYKSFQLRERDEFLQLTFPDRWNAHQIGDNIFLGNFSDALSKEKLNSEGVTHILHIGAELYPRSFPKDFSYMFIDAFDRPFENIQNLFPITTKFIEDAIASGGKVLIHCRAGASRSATLVAAYLMKHNKMTAAETIEKMKAVRSIVNPNPGFRRQLEHYEGILKNPLKSAAYESEFHILNLLGKLVSVQECPKGADECVFVHGNFWHTLVTDLHVIFWYFPDFVYVSAMHFAQQI
eukprot:TRINITY_DN8151_c0_g1_i1.p1 TRINITY_DN8151_c0_g1~~TRINITY_DN8151_c0_g1_i1.p1  ORF type:complete len:256 (-),score=41.32 TRINITY_DN8151_c0_g1_i1:205-972(-)